MLIVTRSGWGAAPPIDEPRTILIPTPRLWVHHTTSNETGVEGMRSIQRYHQQTKGWNDIAYSFVINSDGTIYEGRGVGIAGAHTEGDNSSSHAICLMGNFEDYEPTIAALNSLVALARYGRDNGWWVPTLGGHRDAPGAQTACPGAHLYDKLPRVRELVNTNQEEDMLTEAEHKMIADTNHRVANVLVPAASKIVAALATLTATEIAEQVVARLPKDTIDQATVEAGVRAVFADLAD